MQISLVWRLYGNELEKTVYPKRTTVEGRIPHVFDTRCMSVLSGEGLISQAVDNFDANSCLLWPSRSLIFSLARNNQYYSVRVYLNVALNELLP